MVTIVDIIIIADIMIIIVITRIINITPARAIIFMLATRVIITGEENFSETVMEEMIVTTAGPEKTRIS